MVFKPQLKKKKRGQRLGHLAPGPAFTFPTACHFSLPTASTAVLCRRTRTDWSLEKSTVHHWSQGVRKGGHASSIYLGSSKYVYIISYDLIHNTGKQSSFLHLAEDGAGAQRVKVPVSVLWLRGGQLEVYTHHFRLLTWSF